MNSDFEQLTKAQALLAQALSCARSSMSNNANLGDAKNHMRHAIDKLQKVNRKTQMKKQVTQTEHDNWWGQVVAGTVNASVANVSQEAYSKSLKELNMLIDSEKKKLDDIENQVRPTQQKTELFND